MGIKIHGGCRLEKKLGFFAEGLPIKSAKGSCENSEKDIMLESEG